MIKADIVQSSNLLDVDSNLNVIYQLIDGLRQSQPQILCLKNTTSFYGGYSSNYVDLVFTSSVSNFESNGLSFNSADNTVNVDANVYQAYTLDLTMQYYTTATNQNATVYVKVVEIDENNNESNIAPFYRIPLGPTASGQTLISFSQIFSVKNTTKKIKFQITTSDSTQPSVQNIAVTLRGLTQYMN